MAVRTTEENINLHIKRRDELKSKRSQFNELYDDLTRVMLTRRQGFTSTIEDGDDRMIDIFDGTPMQGARSLANTVGAMIRPEGEVFVTIKPEDSFLESDDEVAEWSSRATRLHDEALRNPKARFRQGAGEVDTDLVVLGTGILFNGIGRSLDHLLFQSLHLKDAYPFFNDEGMADGMYRTRKLALWQAEQMFGLENLSEESRKKITDNRTPDEKIEFLHAVTRRKNGDPDAILAKNLPYEDLWIEVEKKHPVLESGFHEFPFIVPRWDTSSGEDMGRSPGMIALPDANTAQSMGETMLVAGQRVADPPLMAPNDGSFDEVNTFPGGISYYDIETAAQIGGNPFFPLISGANLPLTREMQNDTRNQIMNAFFKNILNLPVDGPQMTATEIIQRKDEFIREVGPVFGRFESDYNLPIATRSFNIMLRAGAFDPIPEILQGQNIKFEFELPVTKIRKQVEAAAVREWAAGIMELSTVYPEARHLINPEEVGRFGHNASSLPSEVIAGRDEYQQKVQIERQELAEAKQAAKLNALAEIAKGGAKAIKDAGLNVKDLADVSNIDADTNQKLQQLTAGGQEQGA